jgi:hypothetical protein
MADCVGGCESMTTVAAFRHRLQSAIRNHQFNPQSPIRNPQ